VDSSKALIVYGIFEDVEETDHLQKYTYGNSIEDLEIGDVVELPASYVSRGRCSKNIGTVVGFGSDYNGPMKDIIRVIGWEEINKMRKEKEESDDISGDTLF